MASPNAVNLEPTINVSYGTIEDEHKGIYHLLCLENQGNITPLATRKINNLQDAEEFAEAMAEVLDCMGKVKRMQVGTSQASGPPPSAETIDRIIKKTISPLKNIVQFDSKRTSRKR